MTQPSTNPRANLLAVGKMAADWFEFAQSEAVKQQAAVDPQFAKALQENHDRARNIAAAALGDMSRQGAEGALVAAMQHTTAEQFTRRVRVRRRREALLQREAARGG